MRTAISIALLAFSVNVESAALRSSRDDSHPPRALRHQYVLQIAERDRSDFCERASARGIPLTSCSPLLDKSYFLVEANPNAPMPGRGSRSGEEPNPASEFEGDPQEFARLLSMLKTSTPPLIPISADYNLLFRPAGSPSDPRYDEQWSLKRIEAPAAWRNVLAADKVLVAVLDSGVNQLNPDILPNLWRNESELSGTQLQDDDGNGVEDDFFGASFSSGNVTRCLVPGTTPKTNICDTFGHGTAVASVLGAVANNGYGMAGVAPNVVMIPIKISDTWSQPCDAAGCSILSDIHNAVHYAEKSGAQVINLSWGADQKSATLAAKIASLKAEIVFVAAAGNEGDDIGPGAGKHVFFPASSGLPNVLPVGSSSMMGDAVYLNSNFGAPHQIFSPGVDILVWRDESDPSLPMLTGTSFAAPMVSGAVAMLKSKASSWSAAEIIDYLVQSGDEIPNEHLPARKERRLNLARATSAPIEFDPKIEGTIWDSSGRIVKWSRPFVTPRCAKGTLILIDDDPASGPLETFSGIDWVSSSQLELTLQAHGFHRNARWKATCDDSELVAWSRPFTLL